jgi:SAM-dependent methyltransferase
VADAPVDLYDHAYAQFASAAETAVRAEAFGEDIGQSSWLTLPEWLHFADLLEVTTKTELLEVGSGSGGPAVYLAKARGCRVTGVDLNNHGVRNGNALALAAGLAERVRFQTVDASRPLPFVDASFDAVVSNDVMCHLANRSAVLQDWRRVLRPGGRLLFSDALVVTGLVSHEELATRSAIGTYFFVPPGENDRLIAEAGFTLLSVEDGTPNAAAIARRWHDARARHRDALVSVEGEANFDGLQRFLNCVHMLSAERRLSRLCYVAQKPGA